MASALTPEERAASIRRYPRSGEQGCSVMHHGSSPDFFSPKHPLPPYLACWHQAFAALDPAQSTLVELLFDRAPAAPIKETIRIPKTPNTHAKQITAMYLAVIINNVLCTFGAKNVNISTLEPSIDKGILQLIEQYIFCSTNSLTARSSIFIHSLIQSIYKSPFSFTIDTGSTQSTQPPSPTFATPPSRSQKQSRPGAVLAINIGQHLTSFAVVRLDAQQDYRLEHFTRLDTWPAEETSNFTRILDHILTTVRHIMTETPQDIEAIALSIAATVYAGKIQTVEKFGLFSWSSQKELAQVHEIIAERCGEYFPGLPITIINDAEAQSLFAFSSCGSQEASGSHFLSLRLGACPSIGCLDASGSPEPGINEYACMALKLNKDKIVDGLFTTTGLYLSHYGIGIIAQELDLLNKYSIGYEQAIPFFYEKLLGDDPSEAHDAKKIYFVLGAYIAMLAFEVHRHRPLGTVVLHGSRANRIDETAFDVIQNGFFAFSTKNHLSLDYVDLRCLKNTSAHAGLVGAALSALRA
jgi:hypothetical protein